MEEWIEALRNASLYQDISNAEILTGSHSWYVCSHARPTFCNVCREALTGVTSHGLCCEICKFKTHKRCASKASRNCKWTTLASIGSDQIIEDEDRNIIMPHQWLEGNLPVNAKCAYCEKACGSVLRMQDFRCLWCKAYVHSHCKDNYFKRCNLGVCRVSILPPTHVNEVTSDGFIRASRAPNSSPVVVFVNSKSGDNQGIKFLRKFKQLLNPFQVFDLINGGPVVGLKLFQKFDCFRVLVCGGDGSVGWVLKEIDNLNLHKQCQIGVLPLGTGNDLARVLGWGAALDDDNQLPKLLESFERATTKMLDRWSIMTYEIPSTSTNTHANSNTNTNLASNLTTNTHTTKSSFHSSSNMIKYEETPQINIPTLENSLNASSKNAMINCVSHHLNHNSTVAADNGNESASKESLANIESAIWFHFSNMLQSENINSIIESTRIFNERIDHVLNMVYNNYSEIINDSNRPVSPLDTKYNNYILNNAMAAVVIDQGIILRQNITEFFHMLAQELIVSPKSVNEVANSHESKQQSMKNEIENESETSAAFTASNVSDTSDESESKEQVKSNELILSLNSNQNNHSDINGELLPVNHVNANHMTISNNSSINRRLMLNSISKLFKNKRKVIAKSNHLKQMMKQMIKLADKERVANNKSNNQEMNNEHWDENEKIFLFDSVMGNGQPAANGIVKSEAFDDCYYEDEGYIHDSDINTNAEDTQHLLVSNGKSPRPNWLNFHDSSTYSKKVFTFENDNELKSAHKHVKSHANRINSNDSSQSNNNDIQVTNTHLIGNVNDLNNFNKLILNELNDMEKMNSCLSHSITSSSIISNDVRQLLMKTSTSNLTISKSLNLNGTLNTDGSCPLASEEQSCMSTPNQSKLSPSIDSLYKQNVTNLSTSSTSPLSRPNTLNLNESNNNCISIKIVSPSINTPILDTAPEIRIECDQSDLMSQNDQLDSSSRSPSFLGYITSASSMAVTPCGDFPKYHDNANSTCTLGAKSSNNVSTKTKSKPNLPPLFLLPPSVSSNAIRSLSVSSNNLSVHKDFNSSSLGIPASPSGYSSAGSCFSKTPLPSPRISKKYSKESKNYLQLPGQGVISALSMNLMRRRSRSKSSDKSSSPTSPSSPKFSFRRSSSNVPFGFIGQALLFNADALCAPITPPVVNEPILELYNEKAVMNNYFGIGLDAKLCLEFHMTREEHPEKCRSRIRNHMLYGLLGSKELVQRTYKNLEQKVLLECDGTKIPLKNVQGIVVLNIPSYTGGVNFWGQNSKDDNVFISPSFDDKILEVVAVSGCMQMALSRVVSLKSNRIAQCRSVKIQILGQEGVPVQVDGEAWIQPPGFIYLLHKNRAQMLTRNKVFEHTLKSWSERQKNDPHLNASLTKDEYGALQSLLDDSITLVKRIKTASLRNLNIEQDLCGYANQVASNLEEISVNGKIFEKSLRQQVTDFLNSIRTLHVETSLFLNEKASKLQIDPDTIEKIQTALTDLKMDVKHLNECHGIFQFPIENDEDDFDTKRKSRFSIVQRYKKSKIKHKDDQELLKTLHSIPVEEWGPEEVSLWLESLNLSDYKSAFMRHDIRGTEIRNLERRDLRELGIVKVGHIKRILNACKEIPKRIQIEKQSI